MEREGNERPDPQDLLTFAEYEESKKSRGSLIIYLGYAAGVGKTYSMLSDGIHAREEGTEIVIGYVETHNRPETDVLAEHLEAISCWIQQYRGISLREPDVDLIIQRKPDVVLIDELAHTNAPGSRHTYRYQDIEDILQAGISVWTTLNIQHIESLNEKVSLITKVPIKETVPDTFVAKADEIRVIDISPEGLIKRLLEGKVYVPDLAVQAVNRFFAKENLLALRQFSLRYTAQYSDIRMMRLIKTKSSSDNWPASERILVPIRPGPNAENLIRAGYRLAYRLDAEWTVISVIEEKDTDLPPQEEKWLISALDTARRLGATIIRYRGDDVAADIIRYAKRNHITTILMGKPKGFNVLFSPVYRIIRGARGIDIILNDSRGNDKPIPIPRQIGVRIKEEYISGVILIGIITCVNYLLTGIISSDNQMIIQLIPVIIISLFFRRDVALVVATVSILIFDFAFVLPYYTFAITDWEYFISFVGYVVIALIISTLATRLRHIVPQIWKSEAQIEAIGTLSQALADSTDRKEVFSSLIEHISRIGPGRYAIFTAGKTGVVILAQHGDIDLTEKESSIAWWVLVHGQSAGRSTDTLAGGDGYFLPIKGNQQTFGVIGFWFDNPEEMLSADNKEIYDSIASLGALALERVKIK